MRDCGSATAEVPVDVDDVQVDGCWATNMRSGEDTRETGDIEAVPGDGLRAHANIVNNADVQAEADVEWSFGFETQTTTHQVDDAAQVAGPITAVPQGVDQLEISADVVAVRGI